MSDFLWIIKTLVGMLLAIAVWFVFLVGMGALGCWLGAILFGGEWAKTIGLAIGIFITYAIMFSVCTNDKIP